MQIYADMDRIDRIESDMANGLKPGYEQVSEWMETLGDERLYELARRIRMRRDGRRIDMCSIMNARSGRCSEDCKWCAQSKFHKTISRSIRWWASRKPCARRLTMLPKE